MRWYLTVLTDATPKGVSIAKKELTRMAKIAQHYHQKIIGNTDNTAYSLYIGMYMTIYRSTDEHDKRIQAANDIANIAKIADEYIDYQKNHQS